ncbi:MAG: hypothetical protein N838_21675 [Thiohalocapsa sp. PB-PSB1]|jgi:hypothetical protein|nr:MAG: hypothetical protein N838_21675 [Thiohalocapsa sp. PB-PSB1]HCS89399.1 hypothetical protein [Chromatiaceae bacterium]
MFDSNTAPRLAIAPACITGALLLICGCASDSGGDPFEGMENPFKGGIQNPFKRPSEDGFFALIRNNCASYSIGGQNLGSLRQTDGSIGTLTVKLYKGDLSNDEYLNLLLQEYPAEDANVPATGCVVNQLDTCLSTDCQLTPNSSPEMERADAMVAEKQWQAEEQEVPMADRGEVEQLMDQADKPAESAAAGLSSEP